MSNDILQPLPIEKFAEYREACAKQMPHAIRGHHFLLLQERWQKFLNASENVDVSKVISLRCKYHFYVHRSGDVNNCTFIAITDGAELDDDYIVFPFTLQKCLTELNDCFRQTKRIKWNFSPLISSIHTDHLDILEAFMRDNGLEIENGVWDDRFFDCVWLSKEKASALEYIIPDDVYIAPLNITDAADINSVWPYMTDRSLKYIESVIKLNDGLGVFDKNTNQLLSWVLPHDNFAPAFLQTIGSAQGRGLAKIVLKAFCKHFAAKENLDLLAFIRDKNTISQSLFNGLGFKVIRISSWFKIKPF